MVRILEIPEMAESDWENADLDGLAQRALRRVTGSRQRVRVEGLRVAAYVPRRWSEWRARVVNRRGVVLGELLARVLWEEYVDPGDGPCLCGAYDHQHMECLDEGVTR